VLLRRSPPQPLRGRQLQADKPVAGDHEIDQLQVRRRRQEGVLSAYCSTVMGRHSRCADDPEPRLTHLSQMGCEEVQWEFRSHLDTVQPQCGDARGKGVWREDEASGTDPGGEVRVRSSFDVDTVEKTLEARSGQRATADSSRGGLSPGEWSIR